MDLFTAIDNGDPDGALAALAAELDAGNRPREAGPTPVLYALYRGRADIARALADRSGELDLAEAGALDRVDRVSQLLDGGAEIDGRTPDGYTPLHLAAFFGAERVAALLIDRGAEVDAVADNDMRIQPLHASTAGRHRAITLRLIAAGAQLDGRQQHGFTPLMAAAHHGDDEVVEALLGGGADPRLRNDDGQSAADIAGAKGHPDLARRLRAAARDVD